MFSIISISGRFINWNVIETQGRPSDFRQPRTPAEVLSLYPPSFQFARPVQDVEIAHLVGAGEALADVAGVKVHHRCRSGTSGINRLQKQLKKESWVIPTNLRLTWLWLSPGRLLVCKTSWDGLCIVKLFSLYQKSVMSLELSPFYQWCYAHVE